jgi:hypothetical protein
MLESKSIRFRWTEGEKEPIAQVHETQPVPRDFVFGWDPYGKFVKGAKNAGRTQFD